MLVNQKRFIALVVAGAILMALVGLLMVDDNLLDTPRNEIGDYFNKSQKSTQT
jgi:hypothetical protein